MLITCAIAASSCSETAPQLTAPEIVLPRFTYDCTLGAALCDQISDAISDLEGSQDGTCQWAGSMARLRFNAEGYGFRPGNPAEFPQYDAYVVMQDDWTWYSGYAPTDYNTYVNPSLFNHSTSSMAGTIAHEEMHQGGWDNPSHTTGYAAGAQQLCS